jgi:mannose-6-phosphate isomerase-like protein (cupin superfamily)
MEIVRNEQRNKKANSSVCSVYEYPSLNPRIDIATATISGREPLSGVAENIICTELVLITKGCGSITVDGRKYSIYSGDSVVIEPGEKFVWSGDLELVIVCTPRWSVEQHVIHKAD